MLFVLIIRSKLTVVGTADRFDPMMDEHDICGYNNQLYESVKDHQRVPARVILQIESYPREAFKNWSAVQRQDYVIGDYW